MTILEFLAQRLELGSFSIGQIRVTSNFEIYHLEDELLVQGRGEESSRAGGRDELIATLTLYHQPQDAREIVKYDVQGRYRPLKGEPNLVRGWKLQLNSLQEVWEAIDFIYPAALGTWVAFLANTVKPTSLRETLDRQTGMYRVTRRLTADQAEKLIQRRCLCHLGEDQVPSGCVRQRLWSLDSSNCPVEDFMTLQAKETSGSEIPILCIEVCNMWIAQAREVVKAL